MKASKEWLILEKHVPSKYVLEAEIGRGGFGVVFRATDTALRRPVAIKMLHREHYEDHDIVERFIREAQIAARLKHRNIVVIYDIATHEECNYFIMEYIEGESIKELLLQKGAFSQKQTVALGIEISDALYYAHQSNVVHRDIKPDNIIITPTGQAIVMDFGIAKAVSLDNLKSSRLFGTGPYIAPEQLISTEVHSRIDQYAFGILLYRMLTRRFPFPKTMRDELLLDWESRKSIKLVMPTIYVPDLDTELVKCIMTCLEFNPNDRFSDMRAVNQILQKLNQKELPDTIPEKSKGSVLENSEQIDSLIKKGIDAICNKQYLEALEYFGSALRRDPNNVEIRYHLEQARLKLEDKHHIESYFSLARDALKKKMYESALLIFQRIITLEPDNKSAQILIKQVEEWILTQKKIESLIYKGNECLKQNHYEEAIKNFEAAVALDPEAEPACKALDNARKQRDRRSGEKSDGIEHLSPLQHKNEAEPQNEIASKIISDHILPTDGTTHIHALLIHLQERLAQNDYKEALEALPVLISKYPNIVLAQELLMKAHELAERAARIAAIKERIRELIQKNELQAAREALKLLIQESVGEIDLEPFIHEIQNRTIITNLIELAQEAEKQNRILTAIRHWQEVQRIAPEHPEAYSALSRLMKQNPAETPVKHSQIPINAKSQSDGIAPAQKKKAPSFSTLRMTGIAGLSFWKKRHQSILLFTGFILFLSISTCALWLTHTHKEKTRLEQTAIADTSLKKELIEPILESVPPVEGSENQQAGFVLPAVSNPAKIPVPAETTPTLITTPSPPLSPIPSKFTVNPSEFNNSANEPQTDTKRPVAADVEFQKSSSSEPKTASSKKSLSKPEINEVKPAKIATPASAPELLPSSAQPRINRANEHLTNKYYLTALQELTEALTLDSSHPEIANLLSNIMVAAGVSPTQNWSSLPMIQRITTVKSTLQQRIDALLTNATQQLQRGSFEEATVSLQQATRLDAGNRDIEAFSQRIGVVKKTYERLTRNIVAAITDENWEGADNMIKELEKLTPDDQYINTLKNRLRTAQVQIDKEPPVISVVKIPDSVNRESEIIITADVKDKERIASVQLFYEPVKGEAQMTVMKQINEHQWQGIVPREATQKAGTMSTWIKAQDTQGNIARYPLDESKTIQIKILQKIPLPMIP